MKKTVIGDTFTAGELIKELQKYPEDMPVCDSGFVEFTKVKKATWIDSNYPWNRPDTEFIIIE